MTLENLRIPTMYEIYNPIGDIIKKLISCMGLCYEKYDKYISCFCALA